MPRGAKPGERRGGRAKGTRNKKTEAQIEAVKEQGMTPLEYLTSVYQSDAVELSQRIDAAKAAAPYVHAKLASVELSGKDGKDLMPTTIKIEAGSADSKD